MDEPGTTTEVLSVRFRTRRLNSLHHANSKDIFRYSLIRATIKRLDTGGSEQLIVGEVGKVCYQSCRYEWLPLKSRFDDNPDRELVRCGQSTPILMTCADKQKRLGYLDLSTEIAMVGYNKKVEQIAGGDTQNCLGIFRNYKPPPLVPVEEDQWEDIKWGDVFPKNVEPVSCLRSLVSGEKPFLKGVNRGSSVG